MNFDSSDELIGDEGERGENVCPSRPVGLAPLAVAYTSGTVQLTLRNSLLQSLSKLHVQNFCLQKCN